MVGADGEVEVWFVGCWVRSVVGRGTAMGVVATREMAERR